MMTTTTRAVLVTVMLTLTGTTSAPAAQQQQPYSCRLLYDEERKCAYDPHCDRRVTERLRKQCLIEGGRP